ncbi:acyl-CoA dehydrogenase family protein [Patulibacter brassicae]|uniref:Acyl-CoA dehydrogenase family protein n=1 Tax=Patulibacter brassicae TaxID=1705717 RepID=A0ABU4VKD3_9ACTN|nr:acyl-CoA dehydrogenase family protein [Patulibacter brassicae]MDX8152306.1 acyl-CoA dehydrogenase family protein [Patulibacter brassicae]
MDLNDDPQQAAYRQQVRAWLDEHAHEAPDLQAIADEHERVAAHTAWQGRLAEAGLCGVTWPEEFGGAGKGPLEQVIVSQELTRAGVPAHFDVIGVGMMGPAIIAHGTPEQKAAHLGPLLHGDQVFCQLFSEPAAGSDLAGITTKAVEQPDGSFRITGQKVWTTYAQHAQYGVLLARTDPGVPKHKGLTMFIVPMDAEGVTVRGLRQISGEAEFNEVFLDEVQVGADAVLGSIGGGWTTALTVLMFERLTLSGAVSSYRPDRFAAALAAEPGAREDDDVRRRLGAIGVELLATRFAGFRMQSELAGGRLPGPEFGLGKVTVVASAIAAADLITDVIGPEALEESSEWAYMTSFLPGLKSAGGTEEILRNTLGERVLGLPPEPRLDKGIPFNEIGKNAAPVGGN